jgi:hypothetical protein
MTRTGENVLLAMQCLLLISEMGYEGMLIVGKE